MKPHDCAGLNDAQVLHADHFFTRLAHWRQQAIVDTACVQIARREAQDKHPLDDDEMLALDAYLVERVEVRKPDESRGVALADVELIEVS